MRGVRAWLAMAGAASLVTCLLGGLVPGGQARAASSCSNASTPVTGVSRAHPVVLIHGWTGGPMDDTARMLGDRLGASWRMFVFDYHDQSNQWADSPQIQGCLQRYLKEISAANLSAGGDGRVYLVGHSMGGLAARFAAVSADLARRIGGLVTLATPSEGSPWGSARGVDYGHLLELLAGLHDQSIPPYASKARVCLSVHHGPEEMPRGCALPPYLPWDVPVRQIAGAVTIRRTLFGIPAYELPLGGDSIVPQGSAQGYLGSGPGSSPVGVSVGLDTVSCTEDLGALLAQAVVTFPDGLGDVASVFQLFKDQAAMDAILDNRSSPALIDLLGIAEKFTPCSHSGLLTDDHAADLAAQDLRELAVWHTKPHDVTAAMLNRAQVPADCDLPAQRLTNGHTTEGSPGAGELVGPEGSAGSLDLADLAHLGYRQALGIYLCNAGGVSWPETLILTGLGGTLLGSFDLGDLGNAEHADVSSVVMDAGSATVQWTSYEGAGFSIVQHQAEVTYSGGSLQVADRVLSYAPDYVMWQLLQAAEDGDRNELLSPDVVDDSVWAAMVTDMAGQGGVVNSGPCALIGADLYQCDVSYLSDVFNDRLFTLAPADNRYGWVVTGVGGADRAASSTSPPQEGSFVPLSTAALR